VYRESRLDPPSSPPDLPLSSDPYNHNDTPVDYNITIDLTRARNVLYLVIAQWTRMGNFIQRIIFIGDPLAVSATRGNKKASGDS
jgi:hypothetical protein